MTSRLFRSAIVIAGAVLVLAACGKKDDVVAKGDAPPTVTTVQVELRPVDAGLIASGLLVAREEAAVSPELSGYRIAQVMVDEGDFVTRGQPMARLDDALLQSQVDQSRANLAQQEVAAERAEAEAGRVAGLDDQGVLSNEAIAERRLSAKSARAGVAVAQAQLKDLQTRQARMIIRAPVSGRVLERTARPGDASSPGSSLFRIARDGLVEMDAEVAETDLAKIGAGSPAVVELPSGVKVQGQVRIVSPRVDQQTKLGRVRIVLPVRADLRPGGFAKAVFTRSGQPVISVPETAIRFDADGASVMVVDADNKVRRVAVVSGARSGGWVELLKGPPAGARVALGGSAFVLDGDTVRVVQAKAPAK